MSSYYSLWFGRLASEDGVFRGGKWRGAAVAGHPSNGVELFEMEMELLRGTGGKLPPDILLQLHPTRLSLQKVKELGSRTRKSWS
jgi:hypothetical protein